MTAIVGIFDSGVGGLSVAAALHRMRPALAIRYVADTAFFPYGHRSDEEVAARVVIVARSLVDEGCTLLVVACNTASSAALEALRATFAFPIVGMEPPLKPALERSQSRRVVVLATPATAAGQRLARLQANHGSGAHVTVLPMPGLADLVEEGVVAGARVDSVLRDALDLPLREGIDAVVLGCTHYGFLREAIEAIVPPDVHVIDAAEPVARRVLSLLPDAGGDPGPGGVAAEVLCYATGDAGRLAAALDRLRATGADLPPLRVLAHPSLTIASTSPGTRT
jgi:glutamate racemase